MIYHFVNSFVNRPGNIGTRTGRILQASIRKGVPSTCICRGAQSHENNVRYHEMGLLGHVPRIMNAVRIYMAPNFNHRSLDIMLFQWFASKFLPKGNAADPADVAHVWDSCPKLIRRLKDKGLYVFLDVPMAPQTYVHNLHQLKKAPFLKTYEFQSRIEERAFAEADRLIAPSEFVKHQLVCAGISENKIRVVEFGVDPPGHVATVKAAIPGDGVKFCFLGNVNLRKGLGELLAAWDHDCFKTDSLFLCGRVFPETKSLLSKTSRQNIIMTGFIKPFDHLPFYDVFVFPTWMEGSAKAVFEAMACGLPVITTHSAGSIVRHGIDGFIIEPGDMISLRHYMQWFKDHPEEIPRMGASARERIKEYTWQRYADRIIDLYRCH